jgi:hypothetical protein
LRKASELRRMGKYEDAKLILMLLVQNDPPDGQAAVTLKANELDLESARRAGGPSKVQWGIPKFTRPRTSTRPNRDDSNRNLLPNSINTPQHFRETPRSGTRRICLACRMIVPDAARFCDHCGAPLT